MWVYIVYFQMSRVLQMASASGRGMQLRQYEDVLWVNSDMADPEAGVKYVETYQYKQGDIVICTYPKSGTHWIINIMWKLKTQDSSKRPLDTTLEGTPLGGLENQDYPRILPTHLKPNRLYPSHIENKGKVVLMLQNPKDVAVSLYYHLRDASMCKNGQTWDEYFLSFIQGQMHMGSCFEYVRQWDDVLKDISKGKSKLQVGVFYYEDFKLRPKDNITRLNAFLGFNRDDAYLETVLKETTLESLRYQYSEASKNVINPFCCTDAGNSIIFRKGQVGDWKNHFTVAQSETLDKLLQEALPHGLIKFRC